MQVAACENHQITFVNKTDEPDYQITPGFRVRDHLGKTRWEYKDLAAALPVLENVRKYFSVENARLGLQSLLKSLQV